MLLCDVVHLVKGLIGIRVSGCIGVQIPFPDPPIKITDELYAIII